MRALVDRLLAGQSNGVVLCAALLCGSCLSAHEHEPITHSFDLGSPSDGPKLELSIADAANGNPIAARISLVVDGQVFVPERVNEHGIRFTSIHLSKEQRFTAVFSKSTGNLVVDLPEAAKQVTATAVHGFQYKPATESVSIDGSQTYLQLQLQRWSDLSEKGWIAIDEHIHYDRLDPVDDAKWLAMLEADGLSSAHFMVLKGGMTPGIWSRQFAYGPEGRASDGKRSLIPGQEYRDQAQGHINLLGIDEVILPYSTGGMGWPITVENYPTFHDVLTEARNRGALTGVAHGGTLGKHATAIADAVLGTMDFWEISNGFIYDVDIWYQLMNCGYFLPPLAGTDLPNRPARETWQPMFGSVRTFLHAKGKHDFDSFSRSLAKGRVFISGGPLIDLTVNGRHIGETVKLPKRGGTVSVRAELSSPRLLRAFKLVLDSQNIESKIRKTTENGIHRWAIEQDIPIDQSGWIAAWGRGSYIPAQAGIDAMAHTNAIRIHVGNQPVRSEKDATHFIEVLEKRRSFYREKGVYKSETQRQRALEVFDQAIAKLQEQ